MPCPNCMCGWMYGYLMKWPSSEWFVASDPPCCNYLITTPINLCSTLFMWWRQQWIGNIMVGGGCWTKLYIMSVRVEMLLHPVDNNNSNNNSKRRMMMMRTHHQLLPPIKTDFSLRWQLPATNDEEGAAKESSEVMMEIYGVCNGHRGIYNQQSI